MTTHKGSVFITVLIVIAGLFVLGGGAYVVLNPDVLQAPTTETGDTQTPSANQVATVATNSSIISWEMSSAGEREHIPYTKITASVDGTRYDLGEFQGSCSEIGASGGVDGTGLLAGELSAVQCWFAGGGDEIGVFAHEDGGYQIMIGQLEESIEGSSGFRGNFSIHTDILP